MTFLMSVGELSPCWDALQYSNHEIIGKVGQAGGVVNHHW